MTTESRGLGRGLTALLSATSRPMASAGRTLPVASIRAGASQPRRRIQQQPLEELAASIRVHGVIQPIVVRPVALGGGTITHEVVAGERRWQAAQLAGLTEIPVVIRELTDQDAVAIALIENIQREELTPAEEARALQRLIGEFALTHSAVAEAVGRSRAAVSNLIRLLDLPAGVVGLIDSRALSMGHARALLGLDSEAERERLAARVVERGLSVRETEALVRKAGTESAGAVGGSRSPSVSREILRTGTVRVQLHQKAKGSGKLIVEFADGKSRDALVAAIEGAVKGNS